MYVQCWTWQYDKIVWRDVDSGRRRWTKTWMITDHLPRRPRLVDHTQSKHKQTQVLSKVIQHGIRFSDLDEEVVLRFRSAIPISKLDKVNPKHTSSIVYLEATSHSCLGGGLAGVVLLTTVLPLRKYYSFTLKRNARSLTAGQRRTWKGHKKLK
jgi:hypothetical protein